MGRSRLQSNWLAHQEKASKKQVEVSADKHSASNKHDDHQPPRWRERCRQHHHQTIGGHLHFGKSPSTVSIGVKSSFRATTLYQQSSQPSHILYLLTVYSERLFACAYAKKQCWMLLLLICAISMVLTISSQKTFTVMVEVETQANLRAQYCRWSFKAETALTWHMQYSWRIWNRQRTKVTVCGRKYLPV